VRHSLAHLGELFVPEVRLRDGGDGVRGDADGVRRRAGFVARGIQERGEHVASRPHVLLARHGALRRARRGGLEVRRARVQKRRRERERRAPENYSTGDAPGGVRVVKLDHPCLYLGYSGVNKALLIERPWADVLKTMAQPLYRHRFGT